MADITVRKVSFEFPEDLPVLAVPGDLRSSCEMAGLSFTMPYLEPYLIRTMRTAARVVEDPVVAADMRNFSAQEGHHFRNHARINDVIRGKLSPEAAAQMRRIEDEMEADYQRFTKEKSLKFNLAYAEGFEAMTFALAETAFKHGFEMYDPGWRELFSWHLAEEFEHRNVTFDAYDTLYGDYFYRLVVGIRAQGHFLRYVWRFSECMRKDLKHLDQGKYESTALKVLPLYFRTLSPRYNPSRIEPGDEVKAVWAKYADFAAA